jgi:HemY protein
MLERPETEFLGLRGLVMQALRGGEERAALALVERARALRPRTPWVLSSLYELQARAGQWGEAEATLAEATKRKALPADESRHHRAVLLHEQSRVAEAQGETRQALQHAATAHELDPGFTPATERYAQLLRVAGRKRPAAKAIEAGWRAAPHPNLAEAWGALYAGETPLARVKHFDRLAAIKPDHPESHVAQAKAALEARLWGEARRHLEAAGARTEADAPPPAPRLCRLMAELEDAQHEDAGAARAWLARAARTHTLDATYVCGTCGTESAVWVSVCPVCRSFDSFTWRIPGALAARRLSLGPAMMPALPVPAPWSAAPPAITDGTKGRAP